MRLLNGDVFEVNIDIYFTMPFNISASSDIKRPCFDFFMKMCSISGKYTTLCSSVIFIFIF